MISQINSSVIRNAYGSSFAEPKEVKQKAETHVSKQGDMSKVERLKEAVDAGEYKVDLQALSQRIAEELL